MDTRHETRWQAAVKWLVLALTLTSATAQAKPEVSLEHGEVRVSEQAGHAIIVIKVSDKRNVQVPVLDDRGRLMLDENGQLITEEDEREFGAPPGGLPVKLRLAPRPQRPPTLIWRGAKTGKSSTSKSSRG